MVAQLEREGNERLEAFLQPLAAEVARDTVADFHALALEKESLFGESSTTDRFLLVSQDDDCCLPLRQLSMLRLPPPMMLQLQLLSTLKLPPLLLPLLLHSKFPFGLRPRNLPERLHL